MTKITGPLMSMEASGSVGGTITFARWKGRPYARMLVKPANPKSAAQTAQRAMMRFLAQAWATLSALEKSSWQLLADAGKYSPFNAYVSYNLDRWTQFLPPIPTPEPGATGSAQATITLATAGVKQITVQIGGPAGADGLVLYRSTSALFATNKTTVVAVRPSTPGAAVVVVDANLETGTTYYYKAQGFGDDGLFGDISAEVSATPN